VLVSKLAVVSVEVEDMKGSRTKDFEMRGTKRSSYILERLELQALRCFIDVFKFKRLYVIKGSIQMG